MNTLRIIINQVCTHTNIQGKHVKCPYVFMYTVYLHVGAPVGCNTRLGASCVGFREVISYVPDANVAETVPYKNNITKRYGKFMAQYIKKINFISMKS